ncbi:MAG: alpha-L-fucosidase [Clostridia bacterium]|jgi:alpha-L-fucosidase
MIPQPDKTPGNTEWFVHDRFGMFIHWGLYALPARHEWVMSYEKIPVQVYEKYFKYFNPDLYNPREWAKAAKEAGMKYFVITTKHHEGFCLWDTAYTWYKAPNTPYGKDLLKPMVEAFREEGLKVGFYHSLLDWHHPHYTVDHCHPMRDNPEYIAQDKERNLDLYVEYLYKQSEELVTKFGKIDILWYDFSVAKSDRFEGKGKDQWRSEKLIELVRKHQPDIIINDRLQIDQDIKTPEQYQPREWLKVNGKPVVWEACQTFSGSWGYNRDEESWKSVDMLVQMLIDTVSKGGNMLLNVGPTARGEFDDRALERLKGIGTWMKRHGRSIYGCTQAPDEYICPRDCRYTYNPKTKTLYLHVFAWPFKHLFLDGMADKVEYAQLLNDASEIIMKKTDNNGLVLNLPVKKPNVTVPVIELFLK